MLTLPRNISCGYFDCSDFGSLTVSPKRTVTRFELEFYLEDGKISNMDDRKYEIKKDHIQIAKPGQIRYSELPFRTAYVKFEADGDLAEKLRSIPEYFYNSHPQRIYTKIDEIILLSEGDNEYLFYSRLLSLLNSVFYEAEKSTVRNGDYHETIVEAKRYIENNFNTQIKLKDVADSVHLSEIYFHSIFKEFVGKSPHQYLIDCRIEHAKKLLWNVNIPISLVAEKSGFGCQQYLTKVFKKETGMTPNEYRNGFQVNYSL